MDIDEGLICLGRWSRWQVMMYLFINIILCFPSSWHMLAIVFVGQEPSIRCKLPDDVVADNTTIPWDKENERLDSCKVYVNFTMESNSTTTCPDGYEYGDEVFSIINQWDLACDRAYLVSMSQTVLVAGVLVGAVMMSMLADKIGRKPVFLSSIIAVSLVGFITAWVTNYVAFAALRFFTGVFQQGVTLVGFVMACELFPPAQRTFAGLFLQCFWALGMFALALFAYLTRHWKYLMLAISLPGFLCIPLFWFLPESLPWLVAVGRIHEAKVILNQAAKFNKVRLPKKFRLSGNKSQMRTLSTREQLRQFVVSFRNGSYGVPKNESEDSHVDREAQYTILDFLKSGRLLIFALIMCYLWCVSALVYYGLSLNTGSLAGDPYLNFCLSGLVEIPAYIIAAFMLQYLGRRFSIASFYILAGIPLFITVFTDSKSTVTVVLSMVGKLGIAAAFASVFLYAPELFPTTLRNFGIGISSVGGRVGNIVAPFTPLAAKYITYLPNIIFGVMSLLAGLLTLLLPETLNRALPLTIEDVNKWQRTLTKEEKKKAKQAVEATKARELEVLNQVKLENDSDEENSRI